MLATLKNSRSRPGTDEHAGHRKRFLPNAARNPSRRPVTTPRPHSQNAPRRRNGFGQRDPLPWIDKSFPAKATCRTEQPLSERATPRGDLPTNNPAAALLRFEQNNPRHFLPPGLAHANGRHTLAGAAPGMHRDLACLWQPWRHPGERSGIPRGSVFLPSLPNWCALRLGLLWRTVRFSPRGQRHERESRRPLPPEAGAPQIGSAEPRSGPGSSSTRRR